MTIPRTIVITGATGYIGGRLIPLLLERGYRVRCVVRDPARMRGHAWLPRVEVVRGDVTDPASLQAALQGGGTVYYLVHSMASGRGYSRLDLEGARNVRQAAAPAGVNHIVYLGGLADQHDPEISPHMLSRIETGAELAAGPVPVTEFRAGVIIGPGSISFEMIRFLTESLPVLAGPAWLRHRGQPIAAGDILAYLLAALDRPEGGVFEVGGPEAMAYTEIMLRYARARGLRRPLLLLPWMPLDLMAWLIEKLTPVPRKVARPLVEGLMADSVVRDDSALRAFPGIVPLDYAAALDEAMAQLHPDQVEPVWIDPRRPLTRVRAEGFHLEHRRREVDASPEGVFAALEREAARMAGWQVEVREAGRRLLLRGPARRSGQDWLEWTVAPLADGRALLGQSAYCAPHGSFGLLRWHALAPFRRRVFFRING